MKAKLQQFMMGRHGLDDLGRFINILALVILVLSTILLPQLTGIVFALIIICFFRIFSRNTYKRSQENESFLHLKRKFTGVFTRQIGKLKSRKTHRFFRCPSCKQTLRVPKGKGMISITCPKCRTVFKKQS